MIYNLMLTDLYPFCCNCMGEYFCFQCHLQLHKYLHFSRHIKSTPIFSAEISQMRLYKTHWLQVNLFREQILQLDNQNFSLHFDE